MKLSTRLLTLEMTNELTPIEKLLSDSWLRAESFNDSVDDLLRQPILVVGMAGIPAEILKPFSRLRGHGCFLIEESIDIVISSQTVVCAQFISETVGGLMRKISSSDFKRLKGILAISAGISINGQLSPGPFFWKFAEIPSWATDIRWLNLNLAVAYTDVQTLRSEVGRYAIPQEINDKMALAELLSIEKALFGNQKFQFSYAMELLGLIKRLSPVVSTAIISSGALDDELIVYEPTRGTSSPPAPI